MPTVLPAGQRRGRLVKLLASGEAENPPAGQGRCGKRPNCWQKAEAEKISLTDQAAGGKILAIGKSNAESYRLVSGNDGWDNFTQLKVMESVAAQKVKITHA